MNNSVEIFGFENESTLRETQHFRTPIGVFTQVATFKDVCGEKNADFDFYLNRKKLPLILGGLIYSAITIVSILKGGDE